MAEQVDVFLEYNDVSMEDMGFMNKGRIKLSDQSVQFKNIKTGKLHTMSAGDIDSLQWVRLANKPGLKFCLKNAAPHRFCGFPEGDLEKIRNYAKKNWGVDLEQVDHSVKGWNYGQCNFKNRGLEFEIDTKYGFEVPLSNVSNCLVGKNEATIEFHQNDDCPVSLMEMRFHIPQDPDNADDDVDHVEEFRKAVMQYAGCGV